MPKCNCQQCNGHQATCARNMTGGACTCKAPELVALERIATALESANDLAEARNEHLVNHQRQNAELIEATNADGGQLVRFVQQLANLRPGPRVPVVTVDALIAGARRALGRDDEASDVRRRLDDLGTDIDPSRVRRALDDDEDKPS